MAGSRHIVGVLSAIASAALAVLAGSLVSARGETLFEKLVMPGALISGHAKLEKDCGQCHSPFSKEAQRGLCLACHKETARDIAERKGFHGKRPDARDGDCRHCHADHKGRGADIVQFDPQTFNHGLTNFELAGLHKRVECDGCHKLGKKFREAATTCIACHKAADPHRGGLGENCAGCHVEDGWKKTRVFDHGKTRFALTGAHAKVACATCHAGERYKNLPRACADCHRINDVHAGRFGSKCETCHVAKEWKAINFDHGKSTKFPLRGGHAKVKCAGCHTGDLYQDKLAQTCVSCHKAKDPHKGSLGPRCETCHNEASWRRQVAFDHDLTAFPLIGLHAAVPCEGCHRTQNFKEAARACEACHKDQHHEGRLGPKCASCHTPNGWSLWRFDHARQTHFPLAGRHAGLECSACHTAKNQAKVSQASDCYSCHNGDDAHHGSFGRSCETCHSATSFRFIKRF